MEKPEYLKWIVEEQGQILGLDKTISCFRIEYNNDPIVLDSWAQHIRLHYISDEELQEDLDIYGIDQEQYLRKYVIPQKGEPLGATARSNVISEILISDLLEFVYGYNVPRCRQHNMSGKTVSEHGTDVIGYKYAVGRHKPSEEDSLIAIEVKAALSKSDTSVVDSAVADSAKDEFRTSLSLNYLRKKLKEMGHFDESNDIRRFQKKTSMDYQMSYGAAGITSLYNLEKREKDGVIIEVIPGVCGADLMIKSDTNIYFVHGKALMELAHEVFERCIR